MAEWYIRRAWCCDPIAIDNLQRKGVQPWISRMYCPNHTWRLASNVHTTSIPDRAPAWEWSFLREDNLAVNHTQFLSYWTTTLSGAWSTGLWTFGEEGIVLAKDCESPNHKIPLVSQARGISETMTTRGRLLKVKPATSHAGWWGSLLGGNRQIYMVQDPTLLLR